MHKKLRDSVTNFVDIQLFLVVKGTVDKSFWALNNCLQDEKIVLKKALLDRNLALKYHYLTRIGLSNIITRWKLSGNDI